MRHAKFSPVRLRIFDFIVQFKKEHDGNSPTNREIMDACKISSTSVVSYYLDLLVKAGLINRCGAPGASRMIEVAGGHWTVPA